MRTSAIAATSTISGPPASSAIAMASVASAIFAPSACGRSHAHSTHGSHAAESSWFRTLPIDTIVPPSVQTSAPSSAARRGSPAARSHSSAPSAVKR